jgi:Nif-specific regulatory protein
MKTEEKPPEHQSTVELETLYQVSRLLATEHTQNQKLTEILGILSDHLGMQRGTIMLLSLDGKELASLITQGHASLLRSEFRYRRGEGINGRVIETKQPAVIPKISEEPDFLDRVHQRRKISQDKEISYLCVPIMIGKDAVGTLSVDRDFDPAIDLGESVQVLSIVASMIAEEVRLRRESQQLRQVLEEENKRLRSELADKWRPENIIGNSRTMREVYQSIHQAAPSDTTVLVRGESGTGKELVAHALHYSSLRKDGPFVKVNCAALNENLLESELFGHEKGAFTGAVQKRIGRMEEADGGTLFLDEIGDFSPATQVKMLRVLQEQEFQRVGSNKTIKANVRIVCATNRDLEQAIENGEFRQDLYYRVNVFPIFLPPLRQRKHDILLLADHFAEIYSTRLSKKIHRISTPAINMMTAYHWPGNVRELENSIERAVLMSTDGVIHGHHLPPSLQTADATGTSSQGGLEEQIAVFERELIVESLKMTQGNMAASARDLGTTSRILRYKVKKYGIDYRHFRTQKGV